MSPSAYARPIDLNDVNNAHTLAVLSVPPGSRVLDIGAADGGVARALVARGCRVTALDVDPSVRQAELFCERVVVGDVEKLNLTTTFRGARFDAILLLDVLEHLRSPAPVLTSAVSLLHAGGRVVLSIPNVAHAAVRLQLLRGRFSYTESGLLDRSHVRFFDRTAIEEMLHAAGLVAVEELKVTRGITETEIPIDPNTFPPEVILASTADPESEIYQFIIVAALRTDAPGPRTSLAERQQKRIRDLEALSRDRETLLASLESQARQRDEGVATLAQELRAVQERAHELEKVMLEASEYARSLEAEIERKNAYAAEIEKEVRALRVSTADLQQRLLQGTQRVRELEAALRERVAELETFGEEFRHLRLDLAVKDAYIADLRVGSDEAGAVLAERDRVIDETRSRAEDQLRSIVELQAELARLRGIELQAMEFPTTPRFWLADRINTFIKHWTPPVHRTARGWVARWVARG